MKCPVCGKEDCPQLQSADILVWVLVFSTFAVLVAAIALLVPRML